MNESPTKAQVAVATFVNEMKHFSESTNTGDTPPFLTTFITSLDASCYESGKSQLEMCKVMVVARAVTSLLDSSMSDDKLAEFINRIENLVTAIQMADDDLWNNNCPIPTE